MKAVILAAGKGTRMKELTNEVPKPMLKVQGKPILEHIIEGVMQSGIRDFCIITGFKDETIESYFGDGSKWGIAIRYCVQPSPDGLAQAFILGKSFVDGQQFLVRQSLCQTIFLEFFVGCAAASL